MRTVYSAEQMYFLACQRVLKNMVKLLTQVWLYICLWLLRAIASKARTMIYIRDMYRRPRGKRCKLANLKLVRRANIVNIRIVYRK